MYRRATALVLVLAILATPVMAFDTGHHSDLSRAALKRQRVHDENQRSVRLYSDQAIQIVQVANWLTDYFTNSPAAPGDVKSELEKLHFDCLFSTQKVDDYWNQLATNTKEAVEAAAANGNVVEYLILMGMSLHAVQDFYTHSNWVEEIRKTNYNNPAGYVTETWWSVQPERSRSVLGWPIATGWYPNELFKNKPNEAGFEHGDYDRGLNHDSYYRQFQRNWDEAYVFAYAGSVEWASALLGWATERNPAFSDLLRNFQESQENVPLLAKDLNASRRIAEWISTMAHDGHWKGKFSGDAIRFGSFAVAWTSGTDSPYVKAFKFGKLQNKLTRTLYNYNRREVPQRPTIKRVPIDEIAVSLRTVLVKSSGRDAPSWAKFFARVGVEDETFIEAMQNRRSSDVQPLWWTMHFVPPDTASVAVTYRLFDQGNGEESDVEYSLGNRVNDKSLKFDLRLADNVLSGDLQGVHAKPDQTVTSVVPNGSNFAAKIECFMWSRPLLPIAANRQ